MPQVYVLFLNGQFSGLFSSKLKATIYSENKLGTPTIKLMEIY